MINERIMIMTAVIIIGFFMKSLLELLVGPVQYSKRPIVPLNILL
jgi:hypothetical protein